jgi:phytoene synthase
MRPEARDQAACRALLRKGSKSFALAARLLPRRVREPATALYAFLRIADDLVDADPRASAATIDGLRARLRLVYQGRPLDHPVDRALTRAVAGHGLPLRVFEAFLEGLAWDVSGRRYQDFAGLCEYAARVAGTVGVLLAMLMGERTAEVLARACDLGLAMQLTNIARDVGEDARRGRIYLPLGWLEEAGIDPGAFLAEPRPSAALGEVVRRLLEQAERFYASADLGIERLPADCRMAIRAARSIYAEIGREVARHGFDPVTRRAVVSRWRKLRLLAAAAVGARRPSPDAAFSRSGQDLAGLTRAHPLH